MVLAARMAMITTILEGIQSVMDNRYDKAD
jgi:hypothetical protein